ncbi:DGQHR domain-containing protein [Mesorhizobium sp. B2-1-5]|uniref:DGQHR domain-containing protein n=1 Tax=Mesorhizobium sp. B2-1-5 TaxID=2589969 RepID=UPI001129A705|nr:DGQHR domain-containing protein [Mesorhizobium sp. B2-1-5]TPM98600.1 DGQHR domain-containing protein [Mesorhizobium sp. B2-1-5]
MATKPTARAVSVDDAPDPAEEGDLAGRGSYTASLLIQGKHRFYTLSMPSDVLGETCMVEPRYADPAEGFQRALDEKRARDIAAYIDSGAGTIPTSIVLSAQPEADLQYRRGPRTLSFNKTPRSFLILDGQHRVYGFRLATSRLRVPVVIYSGLSRTEEARLFMDINTKQRPVPNELILDIKRLADTESSQEALLRDVFDAFQREGDSPLFNLMSPFERTKGKISRVTFNSALKSIADAFNGATAEYVYDVLSSYLQACLSGLRTHGLDSLITNPTMFRALIMLFPSIAERVNDRHPGEFTVLHFDEIIGPIFQRMKRSELANPGKSPAALHEAFKKASKSGFSIGSV